MRTVALLVLACVALSVASYVLYAIDKRAARRSGQRVPERTLHLLALLGGWPGALLAQRVLRHKTAKPAFLVLFWLTALTHVATVIAFVAWS